MQKSLWFRIGYALEKAKHAPSRPRRKLAGLSERLKTASEGSPNGGSAALPSGDELVRAGLTALVAGALDAWRPGRPAGVGGLLRGAAWGAGAALLVDLVRPLLRGDPSLPLVDGSTPDHLLVGLGKGMVYASVVEPRVPGPTLLKGTVYGSAEYFAGPFGGLARLLGSKAPQSRFPMAGHLLDDLDTRDEAYLEHLAFGVALALLYRSSPASRGIVDVVAERAGGADSDT